MLRCSRYILMPRVNMPGECRAGDVTNSMRFVVSLVDIAFFAYWIGFFVMLCTIWVRTRLARKKITCFAEAEVEAEMSEAEAETEAESPTTAAVHVVPPETPQMEEQPIDATPIDGLLKAHAQLRDDATHAARATAAVRECIEQLRRHLSAEVDLSAVDAALEQMTMRRDSTHALYADAESRLTARRASAIRDMRKLHEELRKLNLVNGHDVDEEGGDAGSERVAVTMREAAEAMHLDKVVNLQLRKDPIFGEDSNEGHPGDVAGVTQLNYSSLGGDLGQKTGALCAPVYCLGPHRGIKV